MCNTAKIQLFWDAPLPSNSGKWRSTVGMGFPCKRCNIIYNPDGDCYWQGWHSMMFSAKLLLPDSRTHSIQVPPPYTPQTSSRLPLRASLLSEHPSAHLSGCGHTQGAATLIKWRVADASNPNQSLVFSETPAGAGNTCWPVHCNG